MLESLDKNQKALVGLLSAGIRNKPFLTEVSPDIDWRALVEMAAVHDVLTLVYRPLAANKSGLGVPEDLLEKLRIGSLNIGVKQERDYLALGDVLGRFTASGIPVVPVKGLIFRELYPDPGLRTMGDFDLLIKPCDMGKAGEILAEAGYKENFVSGKHITYSHSFLPDIELHKALVSAGQFDNYEKFEDNAWNRAVPAVVGGVRVLSLAPVDTAVYQVLHMAEHIIGSGFGLRQLCDFVLFAEAFGNEIDWAEFFNIAEDLRIAAFASGLFKLCLLLFDLRLPEECQRFEEPDDRLIEELAGDILEGGIFGKNSNERITANRMIYYSGGREVKSFPEKVSLYLKLLLPEAGKMGTRFRYARKHRFLLPFAWIHRIIYCAVRRDIGFREKTAVFASAAPARIFDSRSRMLHKLGLLD